MQRSMLEPRRLAALVAVAQLAPAAAHASDHLDTPTVIADPSADIGDLYAWSSANRRQLNLVMTIVGHRFSDRLHYVFHIASGKQLGATTQDTTILCRFTEAGTAECWLGDTDYVRGDASQPAGLESQHHRFRVFAGLRDDPFFNNVKGTRQALNVAAEALYDGARVDAAGCPAFDARAAQAIFDRWAHTDGGPAVDTLVGWTPASLVVSVDLDAVNAGGPLLAVWAGTYKP